MLHFNQANKFQRSFLLILSGLFFLQPLYAVERSSEPKIRHLYLTWQHDPCRTMTINLHGIKTPSCLTVYYDTEPHSHPDYYQFAISGEGKREVKLPDGRNLYHIELTHLEPGTRYYFVIGDETKIYTPEMSFKTIPNDETPLLFIEGGDWENTPEAAELAKRAGQVNPQAVFLGGDYPSGVHSIRDYRKWDKWLDSYSKHLVTEEGCLVPMVLAIGNHEVVGGFDQDKEAAPFFFHYFKQGETKESYFSLSFGKGIKLFVLDSGHAASHFGKQLDWLLAELERSQDYPIKMAIYHIPLFPSIRFSAQDAFYHSFYGLLACFHGKKFLSSLFSPKSQEGKKYWMPVFDAYHMTAAFEHHDQTLKRTKLLRNGVENPKGTLYLGDGGWGPKVQYPAIQSYFRTYFANVQSHVHFFWIINIEKERIIYSAMDRSGQIIDQFVQFIVD